MTPAAVFDRQREPWWQQEHLARAVPALLSCQLRSRHRPVLTVARSGYGAFQSVASGSGRSFAGSSSRQAVTQVIGLSAYRAYGPNWCVFPRPSVAPVSSRYSRPLGGPCPQHSGTTESSFRYRSAAGSFARSSPRFRPPLRPVPNPAVGLHPSRPPNSARPPLGAWTSGTAQRAWDTSGSGTGGDGPAR